MAVMHPQVLLRDSTNSPAEVTMHGLLKRGLPDDWEIFHSAGLVFRDDGRGAYNDEVDFVLCHAQEGIICLEVKGGQFEIVDGQFVRIHRDATRASMRNPYRQALDHWHNFRRFMDRASHGASRRWLITYALAFPEQDMDQDDPIPEGPRATTLDKGDCHGDLGALVDRILRFHRGAREQRGAPGQAGIDLIRSLLAPTIAFAASLGGAVRVDERHIEHLTERQRNLMTGLSRVPRVLVSGMAGTGKTLLAVERCRTLSDQGRDVAYVCFTRGLADDLAAEFGASIGTVTTFHKLCSDAARREHIRLPHSGRPDPPPEHWAEHLPAALVEVCDANGGLFDDLVIDEAQDLTDDFLAALMLTLRSEHEGSVWIFRDDNQRVFRRGFDAPDAFVPYELTENFRNTQAIHQDLLGLYQGDAHPTCIGPVGRETEWLEVEDTRRGLADVVDRLVTQDGVAATDVVVLSPFPRSRSHSASDISRAARFRASGDGDAAPPRDGRLVVRFESIKAFKGLEAPVVVLCDVEYCLGGKGDLSELYVALSRARSHCIVVGRPGIRARFESRLLGALPPTPAHVAQADPVSVVPSEGERAMRPVYEIAREEGLPGATVMRRLRAAGINVASESDLIDERDARAALFPDRPAKRD